MSSDKYEIVIPDPDSIFQSFRSFGYTVDMAIADLIDNSISADAKCVSITFNVERESSYVRIEDDGSGMTEDELKNAMKLGSFNPIEPRKSDDFGRFGLGLKSASFSQCKRLTVKSKKGNHSFTRVWDLDLIQDEKTWSLYKECINKQSEYNLGEISGESGTIVLWEKLDRLIESGDFTIDKEHLYRKIEILKLHLGLIFHRLIENKQISISIGGNLLSAVNPFHISETQPTRELGVEFLSLKNEPITIQPYILPHESKLTLDELAKLHMIRGWNEHQGIYLYRNERLISEGTWLDLPFRKKESQRLARIQIDIPNTLDKEWKIDIKKSSAKVPDVLWSQLKRICANTINEAIKVYTHRGAYVKRKGEKKEIVYLWLGLQKNGKRHYIINPRHPIYNLIYEMLEQNSYIFRDFIKLISETLPVNLIVNDFSEQSSTMKSFFEEESEELSKVYHNMLRALINVGVTEEEAILKLNSLDSFQNLIHNNNEKTL